jgi:hypothetical protein
MLIDKYIIHLLLVNYRYLDTYTCYIIHILYKIEHNLLIYCNHLR